MSLDNNVGRFLDKLGSKVDIKSLNEEKSGTKGKNTSFADTSMEDTIRRVVREELEDIFKGKYLLDDAGVEQIKAMIKTIASIIKNGR